MIQTSMPVAAVWVFLRAEMESRGQEEFMDYFEKTWGGDNGRWCLAHGKPGR
jgi:hypothetical protein